MAAGGDRYGSCVCLRVHTCDCSSVAARTHALSYFALGRVAEKEGCTSCQRKMRGVTGADEKGEVRQVSDKKVGYTSCRKK